MFRKLIFLGVFVGVAAAVPVMLEQHVANQPAADGKAAGQVEQRADAAMQTAALAGRKTRIPADAMGHFSGQFTVNGRNISGVVDTGATLVAINESTARRLGIRLSPQDYSREVRTANGIVNAAPVILDRVEVGRVQVQQVPALVLSDRALAETLIGMSFLGKLKRYSVSEGALLLEQ